MEYDDTQTHTHTHTNKQQQSSQLVGLLAMTDHDGRRRRRDRRRLRKNHRKRKRTIENVLSTMFWLFLFMFLVSLLLIHSYVQQNEAFPSSSSFSSSPFSLLGLHHQHQRHHNKHQLPLQPYPQKTLQNRQHCLTVPPSNPANNTEDDGHASFPRGIVVTLLLGGSNPQLLSSMCSLFASQLTHFIVPHQSIDVLLVVSGNIREETLVQCLDLTIPTTRSLVAGGGGVSENNNDNHKHEKEWTNYDGSTMITKHYQALTVIAGTPFKTNVFVASINDDDNDNNDEGSSLLMPLYIQQNKSILNEPIQPPMCQAPIEYIQGTRWYANQMLNLQILSEYDYWIKLDPDVVFVKPFDFHVLQDMKQRGAVLGHAGEYPRGFQTPCSEGIQTAVAEYLANHKEGVCAVPSTPIPEVDRYYTNFLIGRTDIFQYKPLRDFAHWLAEYRHGYFQHRWTDQIFWSVAMTLFVWEYDLMSTTTTKASNETQVIADYTDFRCFPVSNCWMTSLEAKNYEGMDSCRNGQGLFIHSKHAKKWVHRWNRHLARKQPYNSNNIRWQQPQPYYRTTYRHDCQGTRWRGSG